MQGSMKSKGGTVGVPVIQKPSFPQSKVQQTGRQAGFAPGNVNQISASDVRKLRQEIQNLRDANYDLKDALHEARQDFLVAKEDRDHCRY